MKFIDRRFIFPAIALTAPALTASPPQPSPDASAAEAALRVRVQQFFEFQADKKYRAAEPFVAADSQDAYYNGNRYNIKGFSIQKLELLEGGSRAKVTIKANVTFVAPGVPPMNLDVPLTSAWKMEDGQWVWFVDPAGGVETPFGTIKPSTGGTATQPSLPGIRPDASTLQASVKIDKASVTLTREAPLETATISNQLPGPIDLEVSSDPIAGVSVELEKKHLLAGEKTLIRFRSTGEGKGSGMVHVLVSPVPFPLDIRVTAN